MTGTTDAHADTASPAGASAPGGDTDTPSLVTGLHEEVSATQSAADAARGHLRAKRGRYHIADTSAKDLTSLGTATVKGGKETVRLQQKYKGVEVLGGQYVVRMTKKDGRRAVTGTSGSYFTRLKLDSVTPKVSEKVAVRRAVAAVTSQLGAGPLHKPAAGKKATGEAGLSGAADGVTILPRGTGVLTRHITVTGVSPADGSPVKQEVYIDGHSGYPVMQYSGIATFAATATATGGTEAAATAADASAAVAQQLVVKGSGVRYNGAKTEVNLYQGTDGVYQMIDYSKRDASSPFNGPMLATYDARGIDVSAASGRWPSGIKTFRSTTTDLGADFTDSGAVDAHWAAGKVYDYYKNHFGRDGLDGNGGFVYSLVGVTDGGRPYDNAFWDGSKMVYGQGGDGYRTFSADADVVGHEMTHGVVEHTANLVYAGQSGAMNEALADYFGNAIDLEANHISMDDPDSGLLGEDLCTDRAPRDCALRDLDNGLTTSKDFVGVSYRGDNGGVHENSPIFSGALWDIRHDLGGDLADRIVYRALSAYMTPLDGFTEGRNAVVAAAQELGATKAQIKVVKRDFDAHGIVTGWEKALGVDTDTLIAKDNIAGTGVGAGGGKYAVSRSDEDGSEPYSVWAGNTDGKGRPRLMSGNNGDYNVYADTDGRTVVWVDFSATATVIKARPVSGSIEKTVGSANSSVSSLAVDGDYVVYTTYDPYMGNPHIGFINMKTGVSGMVDGRPSTATALPSVKDGKIAYAKMWPETDGYKLGVEVYDTATGKTRLMPVDPTGVVGVGQTAITDDGVFWVEDGDGTDSGQAGVVRAALDGTDRTTVVPESADSDLYAYQITASDDAVTLLSLPPGGAWTNEALPKLYQVAPDGEGDVQRVSCDRGDQVYPAADEGTRVVWLDGTTGYTNLVTREHPAGTC
ncbi:M4 family metallopeptidase [Streptomyces sp. NPDC005281]|uniref:M4 family metallopeptidase n=1 Tax=Streptomyces sp. NPDC005281 TaxID=3155712 RepID=UPI0033A00616